MMKFLTKNILWAVGIFFVIAILFSLAYKETKEPIQLTLDQVAIKINAGEVAKIAVNGDALNLELKNGDIGISKKEAEAGLTETLTNYGVSSEAMQQVSFTITEESGFKFWAAMLLPILLPILIIGAIFFFMFRQAKGGANQAFMFGKAKLKMFTPFKGTVSFDDVAGLKELARAVAGQAGVPFFHISASEFVEMFVGVGASRTRDAFETAKRAAPSILFIDEIDAIGRERGAGVGGGHDEREQTLNQILVEMDGFDKDTNVIVLAATNRPDVLDAALLRAGRFDRRVMVDLPNMEDREAILQIHGRGKPLAKDVNLKQIAVRTPGFSGADLENIMNEAAILAARKSEKQIPQVDLYEAIEKVLLGPERKSKVFSQKEREITAYHEAGHALVGSSLKDADPVHKISVIARGHAGGYTLKLPMEETFLKTRKQFLAEMATLFGGYVAERLMFGDSSTGASNDLSRASEMARKLVTKYGMSEKLGPQTFGKAQELVFLGKEIGHEKNYSEKTAADIDAEVKYYIDQSYQTAKKVLSSQKASLEKIAKRLIEKETIEKEEFDAMLKELKIKKA
ncbi:MAG: ATP-dependent zinc metalloprotease FtsH 1 [Candidatus Wolfebacteria bacterium GW2011_GWA2_47_9b]|uniref:ATP-dependent zinc metalloprotease FtsH 1 n=1 Tax=Candidatus Wolfebacteria bacterium GW2011_GWA2_47_9b TaxID=1619005 RepID=A0A0G1X428_9BACT|nr:MAG: ATP-dependent zinc metalloprotease FtsH 1 [Candidatus Wolfebacteria bacterium GW2011_GWA2_47_9b]